VSGAIRFESVGDFGLGLHQKRCLWRRRDQNVVPNYNCLPLGGIMIMQVCWLVGLFITVAVISEKVQVRFS